MDKRTYSIGQVSKLLGISVQAIRHYQKVGLIVPAEINPETNYRYYDDETIGKIWRITMLQSAGFSLNEIKNLECLDIEHIKSIYEEKSSDLQNSINRQRLILDYLHRQTESLDKLITYNDDIELRWIDKRQGYAVNVSDARTLLDHFETLNTIESALGLHIEVAHQPARQMRIDADGKISLKQLYAICLIDMDDNANLSEQAAGWYVCRKFRGRKDIRHAYKDLISYINENNFTLRGDAIELILVDENISQHEDNFLREIQVAIIKN